jgi:integrase
MYRASIEPIDGRCRVRMVFIEASSERDAHIKVAGVVAILEHRSMAEAVSRVYNVKSGCIGVLKKIEAKGVIDTAHRSREVCGRVFRYAIATGRAKHDIAADLVGALAPRTATHHAAIIDPVKVGELLRAIDGYDGQPTTAAALRLCPYVFLRPTELRVRNRLR